MKFFAKLIVAFFVVLFLLNKAKGQDERRGILDNFSISEHENVVYLSWVIGAGNFCEGTDVYRSIDSLNFEYIGGISGICGHSTEPSYYKFTDKNPPTNQKVYYRLELGNSGFSNTLQVEIIELKSKNYQLRPNPATDLIEILFSNPKSESHQISVYTNSGTQIITDKTNGGVFQIDLSNVASGFYFFHIQNTLVMDPIIGKFIKK